MTAAARLAGGVLVAAFLLLVALPLAAGTAAADPSGSPPAASR